MMKFIVRHNLKRLINQSFSWLSNWCRFDHYQYTHLKV